MVVALYGWRWRNRRWRQGAAGKVERWCWNGKHRWWWRRFNWLKHLVLAALAL
jgi:hypothetical protein